ncbi:cytochrome P450 6k1-like [Ischnura elegans]|uniref:cytochrome P450 6k1-like n=1 Tax=Ischnura elegans TaxID=197161 RepID=UPI001ED86DBE|nr:cytochrome P450 6k1-like [Ischnura elegans]
MGLLGMEWCCKDVFMTLAIMAIIAFIWYAVLPMTYWKRKGIPSAPSVPLFGSMVQATFLRKAHGEVMADIYRYGDGNKYIGYYKFCKPAIVLRDPELIRNVLIRDFAHFGANDVHVDSADDILSRRHIFMLSGEKWKRLRMALSPGFSSGKMKAIYPLIGEVCNNLRAYLSKNSDAAGPAGYEVELKDICARYTTDVVASVAFGLQCDSINNPENEFRKMGKKFMQPSPYNALMFLILFELPWLNKILQIPFVPVVVSNFFRSIVASVVERREKEGVPRRDYLQELIDLWKEGKLDPDMKDAECKKIREAKILKDDRDELDDLTAQALGFFADGSETSSMLLAFALFEMAHNEDIQDKLRQEIDDKRREYGGTLTYEALQDMNYMDMVLKETLRKYPPGLILTRTCTQRYYMPNPVGEGVEGGMWIEEGTSIVVPVYGIQMDPEFYPDPERFDPERFSAEARRDKSQLTYLPFGEGPKMCIGNRFAFLQAKLGMATVMTRFKVLPNKKSTIPIVVDPNHFMMASKHGLWVHLKDLAE